MSSKGSQAKQGIRIIGGQWRGRRLPSPVATTVRPTPDRVRETLFNWLAPMIEGARCLDLFAGTGALGVEALSRGARHVDFVEIDAGTRRVLEKNLSVLGAQSKAAIWPQPADQFLNTTLGDDTRWDVVFLDPPFAQDLVNPVLGTLIDRLHAGHRVYVEQEYPPQSALPAHWQVLREKRAGQLIYRLLQLANTDIKAE